MNVATVGSTRHRTTRPDSPLAYFQQLRPERRALYILFATQLFTLIVLQKFGFPLGDKILQLCLPALYLGLGVAAFWVMFKVDLVRAALYGAFCIAAFISSTLQTGGQSTTSFILALGIYLPFLCYYEVSLSFYQRLVKMFIAAMLLCGVIVIIQHLLQFTVGWRAWPNLDLMVDSHFLVPNYVYNQAVQYKSAIMKPNGIFFLEVSLLSQFTALAFVLEAVFFKRTLVMAALAAILLACFAGTGVLMVALCLPFLIGKLDKKLLLVLAGVAILTLLLAVEIGWFDQVKHRFTEYQRHGTSSNQRFIAPWLLLGEFVQHKSSFFTGWGAGAILKQMHVVWWPVTKVTIEYGILTSLTFHAFLIYSMFRNAPSRRAAFAFFVFYSFMGGGFLVPVYPQMCLLFCSLFRVTSQRGRARSGRAGRTEHVERAA